MGECGGHLWNPRVDRRENAMASEPEDPPSFPASTPRRGYVRQTRLKRLEQGHRSARNAESPAVPFGGIRPAALLEEFQIVLGRHCTLSAALVETLPLRLLGIGVG